MPIARYCTRSLRNQCELNTLAKWIDPFRAHAYAISEAKCFLCSAAAVSFPPIRFAHNRVVLFAILAPAGCKFFDSVDSDEPLHEDLEKLDEETEFLYRNNERFV